MTGKVISGNRCLLLLVLARRMVVCLSLFLFHSLFAKMSPNAERTYLMIKPDGVQRGLVGDIIKRFEQKGFKLVALKFLQVSRLISMDAVTIEI